MDGSKDSRHNPLAGAGILPEVQLLSNGRYHVMLTHSGSGSSRYGEIAISRWREDPTTDEWGAFIYVRDLSSKETWSATRQPLIRHAPDACSVAFTSGQASYHRTDGEFETALEVTVAPEDDLEVRRLSIANHSPEDRKFELTSFFELVLAPSSTDSAHQAFNKLFVETELLVNEAMLLASHRRREAKDVPAWIFHRVTSESEISDVQCETDRLLFVGRCRDARGPIALDTGAPLAGGEGPVLDPIAALRVQIQVKAGQSASVDFVTGYATAREDCLALAKKFAAPSAVANARAGAALFTKKWCADNPTSQIELALFRRLAGALLYSNPTTRASAATISENRSGQSGLWGFSVSGDHPIVLLSTSDPASALLEELVRAHGYWSTHGLTVDLVITVATGLDKVNEAVTAMGQGAKLGKPGGIQVVDAARFNDVDRRLFETVARIVLNDADGDLAAQFSVFEARHASARPTAAGEEAALVSNTAVRTEAEPVTAGEAVAAPADGLLFANRFGGFAADGREYVITVSRAAPTPAPWINVLASAHFGSFISEAGSANTWSENAHEFRLTPWTNDPVSDKTAEAFYIRDEQSGRFWSPTLLPAGGEASYTTRHGFGYSVFEHAEDGIESALSIFVDVGEPVKFAVLRLANRGTADRSLSVTGYVQWVLGDEAAKTRMFVVTEKDAASGAVLASNHYNSDFSDRVAFFSAGTSAGQTSSACRSSFIGRAGSLASPRAMRERDLDGAIGAALDPCAAIRVPVALAAGEEKVMVFILGAAPSADAARGLLGKYASVTAADEALERVRQFWVHTLGAVTVATPEPTLDLLANGWIAYQILSCRLWGRSALYQSGGAFGFRDQLQDVMGLVYAVPKVVREHLILSASRQFVEGDVQHWWHPPSGRGIRSRCSDDFLWLPLAVCRYVVVTGDKAILDEEVGFIEADPLKEGQDSSYALPRISNQKGSLYDHCQRAIRHGLTKGVHGLPLMGAGDWNDGMNLVGAKGQGESVWLGFFLHVVLCEFAELARHHSDDGFADECLAHAATLAKDIEGSAWDGKWYLRAWFDDGTPLGSAAAKECRIDSIAQSWSVLSGVASGERAAGAMDSVHENLVSIDDAIIRLLAPPFDRLEPDPGYIKGYLKGVRENGGQYTHAAVWVAMAYAKMGARDRAWQAFSILDPIRHADSDRGIDRYRTEPYVMASDVYSLAPHVGRGGWTWYTGSAGWMYRFIVDSLLGLSVRDGILTIRACVPLSWNSYRLTYRFGNANYEIEVSFVDESVDAVTLELDGLLQAETSIALSSEARAHHAHFVFRREAGEE